MRMGFLSGWQNERDLPVAGDARAAAARAEASQSPQTPRPDGYVTGAGASFEARVQTERPDAPLFDRSSPRSSPEVVLADDITSFRDKVAMALYETSQDYRMLCSLTHSGLEACEVLGHELRRRLAGNVHYEVLRKLDEAHALTTLVNRR
jgi:hypothetical protein